MKQLRVSVSGDLSDERLLTVPFEVMSPTGELLGEGMASPTHSAVIDLPQRADALARAHVVARLPNGQELQQAVALVAPLSEVNLALGDGSPHEWLQWVTPFRSLEHLKFKDEHARHIGRVWMTLWALRGGQWSAVDVSPADQMRDYGIRQIALEIPAGPHLLQVGGDSVAWRLVSLPPRGRVRVALTRSAFADGDAIEITVGRSQPVNELIMSYLSRGNSVEAARLGDAWQAAELLLWSNLHDPVSAAAGAYLLLKIRRLHERRHWVENLVEWFPDLADGPIVAAALALQSNECNEKQVRDFAMLAVNRGLPVFALGVSTLVETMAAVHRGKQETKRFHAAYQVAQAYRQASCSRGAYFAFYGRSPDEPSWARTYGLSDQPSTEPVVETSSGVEGAKEVLPQGLRELSATRNIGGLTRSLAIHLRGATMPLPAEDWGSQRQRNSFTIFDGDE